MGKQFLRKYWFNILSTLILCGVFFGIGWWVNEGTGDQQEKLLDSAYRTISGDSIFNTHSRQELTYAAIRGMIGSIDDPYAELIEPQAAQNFRSTFQGQTGVVGLYTTNQSGRSVIAIVFPNGAADAAGVKIGDVLLAIDAKTLDQYAKSSEVGLLLRGAIGTKVHLKLEREGVVQEIDLVRKEQQFVATRMLPGGIGYISLNAYNQTASQQMKAGLEDLLRQKPSGLIWDLRSNEGGDMQAVQQILSYFINDGLLFTAQLTNGRSVEFRANGGAIAADLPLAVLIDHTTYSAAETSAATISERGRGTTVGSTTYGKGVIQATIQLPEGLMLQMTVAKWISPMGIWSHGKGVPAQVSAADDPVTEADELLAKAVELLGEK
jgi:carboxyl-terminal processing protease